MTETRSVRVWGALSALLFVVLVRHRQHLIFSGGPSGDDSPAKFASSFGDSGHRDRINIG